MAVLDSEKVAASPLRDVPSLPDEPSYVNEKKLGDSTEYVSRQTDSAYDKTGSLEELNYDGDVLRVNGEVVIRTGADVSNFLLDIRDDEDPALTFRSIVLGTVFAGLGAALCQVSLLACLGGVHALTSSLDILVQTHPSQRVNGLSVVVDLFRRNPLG